MNTNNNSNNNIGFFPLSEIGKTTRETLVGNMFFGGEVHVVVGSAGDGKTAMMCSLAAITSTTALAKKLGFAHDRTSFLITNEGVDGLTIRYRATKELFNLNEQQDILSWSGDIDLANSASIEDLAQSINHYLLLKCAKPGFVIFDNVTSLSSNFDENSTRETRAMVDSMKKLATSTGLATVLIHHCGSKNREGRGSTALKHGTSTMIDAIKQKTGDFSSKFVVTRQKEGSSENSINIEFDECATEFIDSLGQPISTIIPKKIYISSQNKTHILNNKLIQDTRTQQLSLFSQE